MTEIENAGKKLLTSNTFFSKDNWESLSKSRSPSWLCLNSHFNGLHGAQGDISKELCASTSSQIKGCSVKIRLLLQEKKDMLNLRLDLRSFMLYDADTNLSNQISIEYLEYFIETKLADTLHGVTD